MTRLMLIPLLFFIILILGSLICLITQLDMAALQTILVDAEVHFAIGLSLKTALISLILSLFISLPAAWALVRVKCWGKSLINLFLDIPMLTPPLVIGIGLLLFLGPQGPTTRIFPQISQSLFSPIGIIIVQTYIACAILIRQISSAFTSIDKQFCLVAYNMGLSPIRTFLLVEIPLIWRLILSASILALARMLGEFGATLMLAGASRMNTETLPVAVYLNIAGGDFSIAVGCALLLMILALFLLFAFHCFCLPKSTNEMKLC